jgi:hypothetical protein
VEQVPYEIRKSGKKYCVYNKQTNDNKGCSDSKKEAVNHMRALYAAESKLNPSEAKMAAEQVELEEFVAELETELGIELDEDTDTLDTRESDSVDPVEFDAVVAELEAELGIELDADGEDLVATIAHFGYIEDALYHLNILKSMPLSHEALVHVEEAMVALAEYEDAPEEKVTGVALSEPLQISDAPVSTDSMEEFPWEGPIVFEGVMTGDNRLFKKDAIQWEPDTLPWAFRWQKHSDQGHGGAVPVGRVDKIQRFDDGSIHGYGVVIPALSEEASEYLRLLQSGVGGGVSVDGDSAQFDIVDDPKIKAPPKTEFSYMRLRALSAVDVPAFNHARIHLGIWMV